MVADMNLSEMALGELEGLYRDAPVGPPPSGLYRGRVLRWLETPAARRWRPLDAVLFEKTRFGVDFDRRLWWFIQPKLALGRFVVSYGPSRWRPTDTFRLEYAPSRLPVRALLYDEVKPLEADLCLGIGGLNADRGEGEHFFFSLTRA
jgi:hypothetical protein